MRIDRSNTISGRRFGRRAFVGGAAAGAASGIVSLAGCAVTPLPPAATSAPVVAPPTTAAAAPVPTATAPRLKLGGTFRVSTQTETPNLDLHQVSTTTLLVYGPGVAYSRLLQYRADVKPGETVPTADLAESWDQPDERTYVFKLRRNAKYQNIAPVNGRAVTAEDVKFSFDRQIALRANSARLPKLDKVEVVDPYTVKLTAPTPDADFLVTLANTYNKVIPKETVDLKGDLKEGPIIGSGPWIYDKWQKDSLSSVTKNPDYYLSGYPRVDRLEVPRIADVATVNSGFRAKGLDVVGGASLTFEEADRIRKAEADAVFESYKTPQGVWLMTNSKRAPFTDIRARQAIFKAIDKQAIMDTLFSGQAWYYPGVPMPSEDYYLPEAEAKQLHRQDLEAARQLLAQAGGAPPELEIYALGFGTTYKDTAELIQADLKKIGVNTRIKLSESNAAFTQIVVTEGNFDLAVSTAGPVSTNAELYRRYHSTATQNAAVVKDPAFDAMIDKQATLVKDPEGRKKLLLDIQRYIITNAQALHLLGTIAPSLRWKYVQDFFYVTNMEETFTRLWLDK
jgi:peptide/nickel transport system substrate-binding protein